MQRTAEELLEKIDQAMFQDIDFDEVLDQRDCTEFDSQWVRVYYAVEDLKAAKGYSLENKKESDGIREQAYKKICKLCEGGELAEYISDDFGLIADSKILGYKDKWLDKLAACYDNSTIPCGEL